MRSIDELIASLKPKPRTYCFDTVPGKPTVTLREVDADNPVWLLHRLRKEQGGETAPATPTTIAEVERQVAADALQIVEIYVDTVTVDGELLTAEDEELTPTMKLKRSFVQKKYAALKQLGVTSTSPRATSRWPSYQADSNWRNSRRTTSSRVRLLPPMLMRQMLAAVSPA